METRIQRSKRIRESWADLEDKISRMEEQLVEEASTDAMRLASAMRRRTNPFKSVDSLSDEDRWAESEEFFRIYGDGIRSNL